MASLAALLVLAAVAPAQSTALMPLAPAPAGLPGTQFRAASTGLEPARFQGSGRPGRDDRDGSDAYDIQLAPPGIERLSRLDSDEKLFERIRQERLINNPNDTVVFPESPILSRDRYAGRGNLWQRRQITVEPNYVCYGKMQRLLEDTNQERYGWDFGPASVPLAYTKYIYDVAFLPMKTFANPCRLHECSAGRCLPGDPVPFMLYPMEFNVPGVSAEVATIIALVAIFP